MNHVTIADGCSIQGSVICSNVQLQERVVLKDCQVISLSLSHECLWMVFHYSIMLCPSIQVGAGFVVTAGSECKGEAWAKKEK